MGKGATEKREWLEDGERLKLLESALDAISEGILITDAEGRIVYLNRALEQMEGLKGSEVVGRHLTEVYQVTPENSEHLTVSRTGRPIKDLTKMHFTAEGREVNLVTSTYPVFSQNRVVGVFSVCRDVTRLRNLLSENLHLQKQVQHGSREQRLKKNGTRYTFRDFIYSSPAMERLVHQAQKAARADCAVLVYGETGTGKEVIVQSIHNASSRREEPFVGINCAAIPDTLLESLLFGTVKGAFTGAVDSDGLFAQAGEGTLFLDEINSMSPPLQAKLLRVLQEKNYRRVGGNRELPVNCRIISSTNLDPLECIRRGTLREDLYYRFAVFTIYIPPLREHLDDLDALVSHFIARYGRFYGLGSVTLDPELRESFMKYQWPGNVRELEHIIESCLAMLEPGEKAINHEHLPAYIQSRLDRRRTAGSLTRRGHRGSLHQILQETERMVIEETLSEHCGNISRSARALGILRQNLQYRMRRLGIKYQEDPSQKKLGHFS